MGTEDVRGTETRHFKSLLSLTELSSLSEVDKKKLDDEVARIPELGPIYDEFGFDFDLWIDRDGLVRRYRLRADLDDLKDQIVDATGQKAAPGLTGTTDSTIELFDFGEDVHIDVPSPSELRDPSEGGGDDEAPAPETEDTTVG